MTLFNRSKGNVPKLTGQVGKYPPLPRESLFLWDGLQPTREFFNPLNLYYLYIASADLNSIIFKHVSKVLRRGFTIEPKFLSKCRKCGKEYKHVVEKCDCGGEIYSPSSIEKDRLTKMLEDSCNQNDETLHFVMLEFLTALDIFDDAYLVLQKEYLFDKEKTHIVLEKTKNIYTTTPLFMRMIANERGVKGTKWFCLNHRETLCNEPGKCAECGLPLYEAFYASVSTPMAFTGDGEFYYAKTEVLHYSMYSPSRLYGLSPLIPLYDDLITLILMVRYIGSYYRFGRSPRGIVWSKTANTESFLEIWNQVLLKIQSDPLYIPAIAFPSGFSGEGEQSSLNFLKLNDTISELQYNETRNELRRKVAAYYGLSNLSINDTTGVGGMNQETQQLAVEDVQLSLFTNLANKHLFPKLLKNIGITDHKLVLLSPSPRDERRELDLDSKRLEIAERFSRLGVKVNYDSDDNTFEIESGELTSEVGMPMGPEGMAEGMEGEVGLDAGEESAEEMEEELELSLEDKKLLKSIYFEE